jgi:hypothetical protein
MAGLRSQLFCTILGLRGHSAYDLYSKAITDNGPEMLQPLTIIGTCSNDRQLIRCVTFHKDCPYHSHATLLALCYMERYLSRPLVPGKVHGTVGTT